MGVHGASSKPGQLESLHFTHLILAMASPPSPLSYGLEGARKGVVFGSLGTKGSPIRANLSFYDSPLHCTCVWACTHTHTHTLPMRGYITTTHSTKHTYPHYMGPAAIFHATPFYFILINAGPGPPGGW